MKNVICTFLASRLVVATWTGIPVTSLLQTEAEKLLDMEEHLHERIVGQDEAINAIAAEGLVHAYIHGGGRVGVLARARGR